MCVRVPLIFAKKFALSNGLKLPCDEIQTGLQILIPESGHTSECKSDSMLHTSSNA